jgi:hypothetical protein
MRRICGAAAVCMTVILASPAPAGPTVADFLVFVSVGAGVEQVIPNGGTVTVTGLEFKVGLTLDNDGGEEATARARFTLPTGLRFGRDAPDPTERCVLADLTAECDSGLTVGTDPSRRTNVWVWDAVAERAGSYMVRAEVVQTSVADPDLTSNSASATIVVRDAPSEGVEGAAITVSRARVTPAKPKAGARVSATVRVRAGGTAVRPTAIVCTGTAGSTKVKGIPKAALGSASCAYRPPLSAEGKTLRGAVAFSARGTRFTKRFTARLG